MSALELLRACGLTLRSPAGERFRAYVAAPDRNGCWNWQAGKSQGYGHFRVAGRTWPAHRFSYELHVGPIPAGLELDHLCRNHSCVNPAHLEPVTSAENKARGNGIGALNARKTHCKHGHEFTPENTHWKKGGRECRQCWKRRWAERAAAGWHRDHLVLVSAAEPGEETGG